MQIWSRLEEEYGHVSDIKVPPLNSNSILSARKTPTPWKPTSTSSLLSARSGLPPSSVNSSDDPCSNQSHVHPHPWRNLVHVPTGNRSQNPCHENRRTLRRSQSRRRIRTS